MKIVKRFRFLTISFCILFTINVVLGQAPPAVTNGKTPIIIIPGLTGSELVNSKTGEEVWFKAKRSKDDDLRLPISSNLAQDRDNLVPRDILRSIKLAKFLPESEIYERLINALETRGGYKEGNWDAPGKDGFQDTFYSFPYDWRRDNVENARLLVRRVEALKRKLGKPNLKFNIVAHSMGGLIVRYAAMYGNADLSAGAPKPTWAGAKHFEKIFLLGTPNEGSVATMNALLNGYSYVGGGVKLPFIQNIDRFDVFTMPSSFQLLPHNSTLLAYDEDLKRIKLDIYDPLIWDEYDWSVWKDPDFTKKMSVAEQKNARGYFAAALSRAKQFQLALDANTSATIPVSFYLIGADCKETGNGILLVYNNKKDRWETKFKADGYTKSNGEKVTEQQIKPLLFTTGDGVVPKRSLAGDTLKAEGRANILPIVSELYQCEVHNKLVTNPDIQDKLFLLLNPVPTK